jgi:hypothetical protein
MSKDSFQQSKSRAIHLGRVLRHVLREVVFPEQHSLYPAGAAGQIQEPPLEMVSNKDTLVAHHSTVESRAAENSLWALRILTSYEIKCPYILPMF